MVLNPFQPNTAVCRMVGARVGLRRAHPRTFRGLALSDSKGFTLFELLAVMAVFILLTSITIASDSRFGGRVALEAVAYDIALSIREAQIYGVAVRRTSAGSFNVGYGMHFTPGTGYELYADLNGDGIRDVGETVKATTMSGYTISSLCAPEVTGCDRTRLDLLFRRPEPDACIGATGAATLSGTQCISGIPNSVITITSSRGGTATVVVESTGQISVR
jgi:prepilin-type N-terminal cleavage/methylation domain-containing protein